MKLEIVVQIRRLLLNKKLNYYKNYRRAKNELYLKLMSTKIFRIINLDIMKKAASKIGSSLNKNGGAV